jgi:hypothetical protein
MRHLLIVTVLWCQQLLVGEGVVDLIGVDDLGILWAECQNEVDKLLHRLSAHGQHSVLHHEVDESEEFLQFTKLIGLLRVLLDVEPALANVLE